MKKYTLMEYAPEAKGTEIKHTSYRDYCTHKLDEVVMRQVARVGIVVDSTAIKLKHCEYTHSPSLSIRWRKLSRLLPPPPFGHCNTRESAPGGGGQKTVYCTL